MKSFYHFMMRYRGNKVKNEEKQLADWMFLDNSFPKQSVSYYEVSDYLEFNSPFPEAIQTFDRLWEEYIEVEGD